LVAAASANAGVAAPIPNSSAPATASRMPLTRMACTRSFDFQITSAINAIPIRNIGM
jgi:hypothetical protein